MRLDANALPIVFEAGDATIRATDWGELRILLISLPAGTDATSLLSLTDHRRQCPHWGYVRTGEITVTWVDTSETFRTGDVYFTPPGHTVTAETDAELIELSPPHGDDEVLGVLRRNANG